MAVRFNIDKYQEAKTAYIEMQTGKSEKVDLTKRKLIDTYKMYLEQDADIRKEIQAYRNAQKQIAQNKNDKTKPNKKPVKQKQNNKVIQLNDGYDSIRRIKYEIKHEMGDILGVIPYFSKDGKFIRSFIITPSNLETILRDSLFRSSMQIGQLIPIQKKLRTIINKRKQNNTNTIPYLHRLFILLQDEINRFQARNISHKTESPTLTTIDWSALSLRSTKNGVLSFRLNFPPHCIILQNSNINIQLPNYQSTLKDAIPKIDIVISNTGEYKIKQETAREIIQIFKDLAQKTECTNTSNVLQISENNTKQTQATPSIQLPQELEVCWSKVHFFDGRVTIDTPIPGKPIVLTNQNVRKSYEQIRNLLLLKLPPISIIKDKWGRYQLKDTIQWQLAIQMLQKRYNADNIVALKPKVYQSFKLTMDSATQDQDMILKHLQQRKQTYINYLIKQHALLDYKIIPAKESLAHSSATNSTEEDAFIFTIPSKRYGCVTVVYENCNIARTSIVLTVKKETYIDSVKWLYNFMGDEKEKNKRERLRAALHIGNRGIISFNSINHTDLIQEWEYRINNHK